MIVAELFSFDISDRSRCKLSDFNVYGGDQSRRIEGMSWDKFICYRLGCFRCGDRKVSDDRKGKIISYGD